MDDIISDIEEGVDQVINLYNKIHDFSKEILIHPDTKVKKLVNKTINEFARDIVKTDVNREFIEKVIENKKLIKSQKIYSDLDKIKYKGQKVKPTNTISTKWRKADIFRYVQFDELNLFYLMGIYYKGGDSARRFNFLLGKQISINAHKENVVEITFDDEKKIFHNFKTGEIWE